MSYKYRIIVIAIAISAIGIFTYMGKNNLNVAQADSPAENPLLSEWTGPFGGVPPFDKVKVSDFKPALEAAMAENLAEIDKIANDPVDPTFENTIVALERSGASLDRVSTIYGIWSGNLSSPEIEKVQSEMAPKLAAISDKITQNEKLFKRIEAVYNVEQKKEAVRGERYRLAWVYYTNFIRAGAKLGPEQKARLGAINQELAGLFTKFSQNCLVKRANSTLRLKVKPISPVCLPILRTPPPRLPRQRISRMRGSSATPDRLSTHS